MCYVPNTEHRGKSCDPELTSSTLYGVVQQHCIMLQGCYLPPGHCPLYYSYFSKIQIMLYCTLQLASVYVVCNYHFFKVKLLFQKRYCKIYHNNYYYQKQKQKSNLYMSFIGCIYFRVRLIMILQYFFLAITK